MDNDITIDPAKILELPDNSITDAETIRQIALYSNKTGDLSLISKVKESYEIYGLYPEVIKIHNILPENKNNNG